MPFETVAERVGAVSTRADEVALNQIASRGRVGDEKSVGAVAGNYVARAGRRAAEGVGLRSSREVNAGGSVGHCSAAVDIGDDEISLNHVAAGAGIAQG